MKKLGKWTFLILSGLMVVLVAGFGLAGCGCPPEEPAAEEPAAEEPAAEEPTAEEPAAEEPAVEPAFVGKVGDVSVTAYLAILHNFMGMNIVGLEYELVNNGAEAVTAYPENGVLDTCLEQDLLANLGHSGRISTLGVQETAVPPFGAIGPGETAFAKNVWVLTKGTEFEVIQVAFEIGGQDLVFKVDNLDPYRIHF